MRLARSQLAQAHGVEYSARITVSRKKMEQRSSQMDLTPIQPGEQGGPPNPSWHQQPLGFPWSAYIWVEESPGAAAGASICLILCRSSLPGSGTSGVPPITLPDPQGSPTYPCPHSRQPAPAVRMSGTSDPVVTALEAFVLRRTVSLSMSISFMVSVRQHPPPSCSTRCLARIVVTRRFDAK